MNTPKPNSSKWNLWSILTLIFSLAIFNSAVLAQGGDDDDDDDDLPDVSGVYVDTNGVLRVRKLDKKGKLNSLRKRPANAASNLVYISLPKLFAEVKQHVDNGKRLPADLRLLKGMVKLKYIFVYPEKKDIVIAGLAEPIESPRSSRPYGKHTGRPVLQLDDLVVALRINGPGTKGRGFGCSIDIPKGGVEAVNAVLRSPSARRKTKQQKAREMVQNVGPQDVRIFGVPNNTRFAFVCLEADYLMKRQSLGLDPAPHPHVKYTFSRSQQYHRAWFQEHYEPILVSEDGKAYEIRGQGIKLAASGNKSGGGNTPANAKRYVTAFTKFFPKFVNNEPAYADLQNLSDLALVASMIRKDRLARAVSWNLDWIQKSGGYRVRQVPVPTHCETLANYKAGTYAVGGVYLNLKPYTNSRETDKTQSLKTTRKRPHTGWFVIQSLSKTK